MRKIAYVVVAVGFAVAPGSGPQATDEDRWSSVFPEAGAEPRLVLPEFVSTGDDESHPTLSPDGRTLYFLKNTPSFDFYTIVFTERDGGRWTDPSTVSFSGQYPDGDLVFSRDGTYAFFVSARPVDGVPRKDTEIWTVERTASGWGEPRHVAELSSPTDEWFPTLTADGTMYFGSGRDGGLGGSDIWRAQRVDGVFQAPENLGAPVNSPGEEIEAFVTPDESLLVIAAKNRGDALGSYDLYLSRRGPDGWTEPQNPGAPINSPAWEFSPRMSPDGALFFFTSNRGFGSTPLKRRLTFDALVERIRSPGNGLRDIYVMDAAVFRKEAR
jgi:Tol biopolymer transport system component